MLHLDDPGAEDTFLWDHKPEIVSERLEEQFHPDFPLDAVPRTQLHLGEHLSAANSVIENGGRSGLLDKCSLCERNSTKTVTFFF